jgi:recombination protein RecT
MKTIEIIKPLEKRFNELSTESKTGLVFAKESAFAMQTISSNQYLQRCSKESIQKAVLNVALIGLSLNPSTKLAYLVPRGKDACLDISYQGLVKLLTDTGSVVSVFADVIRKGDLYEVTLGTKPDITHKPNIEIGAYSIAHLSDGSRHICFMNRLDLEKVKASSQYTGKGSVWEKWEDEMFKKTVIKRHYKQLPKSERELHISQAIETLNETDGFTVKKGDDSFDGIFDVDDAVVEPTPAKEEKPKKEPKADKDGQTTLV